MRALKSHQLSEISKRFLLFLTLFISKTVACQNIVPNDSFEDVNICENSEPCSPSAWFYINYIVRGYGKSQIQTIAGDKYLLLTVIDTAAVSRDYWQTMLLCPLEAGKKYKLSLKLASEYFGPNLNDIGFFFTDHFIFSAKDTLMQPGTYLNILDARVTKLKRGWFGVEKEFTVSSGNQFLIIGNFSDKTNKQITSERGINSRRVYLFVDDLSIISMEKNSCLERETRKDSLYSIKQRHFLPEIKDSVAKDSKITNVEKTDTVQISNLEFDYNSSEIKNSEELEFLYNYLVKMEVKKIKVVGYTDSKGSISYNNSLSAKRAKAVANFIINRFGIKEAIIEVEGKGVSNKYSDPQQNRRVEIYIYH